MQEFERSSICHTVYWSVTPLHQQQEEALDAYAIITFQQCYVHWLDYVT